MTFLDTSWNLIFLRVQLEASYLKLLNPAAKHVLFPRLCMCDKKSGASASGQHPHSSDDVFQVYVVFMFDACLLSGWSLTRAWFKVPLLSS